MKIFSLDPGMKNYGFSVISDDPLNVIEIGHIKNTITSIKKEDLKNNVNLYLKEIKELLSRNKFSKEQDIIIIERYQSRGNYRNVQLEIVNIMIGILIGQLYNILLIMPATWKNFIKKNYGTNKMPEIIKNKEISPHIKDSIGMASYIFERHYDKPILNTLSNEIWIDTCQK